MDFSWKGKKILITGGASFIGSHLADRLIEKGARVRIADDLSSGRLENIKPRIDSNKCEFMKLDLLSPGAAEKAVKGSDIVFHLAARHGGRGYVETRQVECSTNMILDGMIFKACRNNSIKKVVYASSGCVYPNFMQKDPRKKLFLSEKMAGPPYDADNMYGWAKLMGEMTLKEYYKRCRMRSVSLRYFTAYGPRALENHAVMAMISRAFLKEDPIEIWGTGRQVRNWTYIDDIVSGTIKAAEKIDDSASINIGSSERVTVEQAAREVIRITGHKAKILFKKYMPSGPMNRVADNSLAKKLLDWRPQVKFKDGLKNTIAWYFSNKNADDISRERDNIYIDACKK